MKYILSLLFLSISIGFSFAQSPKEIRVRLTNTPNGVFIEFGNKSLVGHNLELWRKAGSEPGFRKIATLKSPEDKNEVTRKIAESQAVFIEGSRPSARDLDNVWQKYKERKENILTAITLIPQLEYVFGMAYIDAETKANVTYQYQIIENRNVLATSAVHKHLRYRKFPKLISTGFYKDNQMIRLEFGFPQELQTTTRLQVQRKIFTATDNEYKSILPDVSFATNKKNFTTMSVLDTTLKYYSSYNYRIKVGDIWGNLDSTYSYFEADNILDAQLPEIKNIKITSSKEKRALIVTWEVDKKEIMQSLKLYRSDKPDGKFEVVANLNGKDNAVTDPVNIANELYHYYFETKDIFGNTRTSIKFHGIYDGAYKPVPPVKLSAKANARGVDLNWESSDFYTRGYYVFRKQGINGDFNQISPLLTNTTYLDTTKLNAEYTHFYAIKAESDTYDKSDFSDTASFRPAMLATNITLKPPFNLNLSFRDGKIRLSWENLNAEIPEVLGYQVYRKKASDKDYKLITEKILPFRHNYHEDSTFLSEDIYQYAVVSTDFKGKFSSKSQATSIDLSGRFVMLPMDMGAELLPNAIVLKWTELETARIKQIRIYRAEENGQSKLLTNLQPKLKNFTDSAVTKGKSYIYQISTIDLSGKESERTEPLQVSF